MTKINLSKNVTLKGNKCLHVHRLYYCGTLEREETFSLLNHSWHTLSLEEGIEGEFSTIAKTDPHRWGYQKQYMEYKKGKLWQELPDEWIGLAPLPVYYWKDRKGKVHHDSGDIVPYFVDFPLAIPFIEVAAPTKEGLENLKKTWSFET